MSRRFLRGARPLALGLALGLLLAACNNGEDGELGGSDDDNDTSQTEGSPGEPQQGGSITVGLEAETTGWSPWGDTFNQPGMMVARAIYDPLMDRDAEGLPHPNVAESMEPNDDYTVYTLRLNEGIEFHDGEPLNAEAVVANLEKHREPGAVSATAVEPIEELIIEDEYTVRMELNQPHVAFAGTFSQQPGFMVSPASIEAGDTDRNPVGTGPFQFDSWQRDQVLTVTRNENYWRDGLPYLDEINFRPIPDEDARLQSLFSGDVDAMHSLRQSVIGQARERSDEYNLYEHIGNNSGGAIYNNAVPPFDDVRVRRAVAHGLNQEEIIAVLGGTGISPPSVGLWVEDSPWYDERMAEAWPQEDLDAAQEYYDEYVNDPDRSDGKGTGEPISFTVDTPPDPSLLETASVYQALLARVGFDVDVRTVEQAVHIQEAIGGPPDFVGDYEAKFWRLGSELDPDWMVSWFQPGATLNFPNYESEELMDLLMQGRQTPDFEERREIYTQAMLLLAEDVPFTLSGPTATVLATDPNLYGPDDWELPDGTPGVGHPESVTRWHEVWLDE